MILQRFFFVLSVFVHSIFISYGQDKPPVAVDDTVFCLITSEPLMYDINIYPLLNDYSQDMHPIKVASVVSGSAGSIAIAKDSTIEIIDLFLEENYTITYRIKDKVNDLLSEPANIYLSVHRDLKKLSIKNGTLVAQLPAFNDIFSTWTLDLDWISIILSYPSDPPLKYGQSWLLSQPCHRLKIGKLH